MRYAYGLLLALACACGGGGTPAISQRRDGIPPRSRYSKAAASNSIGDFLGVLEIIEGLLDPNETNPAPIVVVDVDPVTASVNWNLDLDADMTPDLMGSLHFTNDQGEPETGADVNQLAGGLDDLDAFITSLPNGTNLTVIAGAAVPPPLDVGLDVHHHRGRGGHRLGDGHGRRDPDCQAAFDILDASLQDIGGAYPKPDHQHRVLYGGQQQHPRGDPHVQRDQPGDGRGHAGRWHQRSSRTSSTSTPAP